LRRIPGSSPAWRARKLPAWPREPSPALLSIAELIERFWGWAKVYYQRPDGTPTGYADVCKAALRPVLRLFSKTLVAEFTPQGHKLVRAEMVRMGWCRNHFNAAIRRVRRCFKWGVEEGIVPHGTYGAISAVCALKKGRTECKEKELPGPVSEEHIAAVMPHVSKLLAGIIQVMRLSGCRPGEVIRMTVEEIDRSDPGCWLYRPSQHKTAHRDKSRLIYLGPKCVEVITSRLVKAGTGRVFKITKGGLKRAIDKACDRAGIPRWQPNRLRHSHATAVRKAFGVEASQVMLGHAHVNMTELYAERDGERGRTVEGGRLTSVI
jgi:integrase